MTIHIEDLKFQCIIGILDFERTQEQDVIVTLEIEYTYNSEFINYADVASFVQSTMQKEKFLLIEDALEHLSSLLQTNFSNIVLLNLKITKPSILPNCKVSVSNIYKFNS